MKPLEPTIVTVFPTCGPNKMKRVPMISGTEEVRGGMIILEILSWTAFICKYRWVIKVEVK